MVSRRLVAWSLLAASALPVADAAFAAPPGGPSSRAPYCAVLGAVSRPGVYACAEGPELSDLLRQAGGVTPASTGGVRIVRGGKAGMQAFLTPGLRLPLVPGDVIVVDGQPGRRSAVRQASHTADGKDAADAPPVPLAFVNIVDRPVVLKVRAEHATVEKLVELLGQRPETAASVTIVPTGNMAPGDPRPTKSTRLPAGTVLVFNRAALDLKRIPPLPAPQSPVEAVPPPVSEANVPLPFRRSAPAEAMPAPTAAAATGPSFGAPPSARSQEIPFGRPESDRQVQLAGGPENSPQDRTANSLSGGVPHPNGTLRTTELLPPPPAIADAGTPRTVEILPPPTEAGPSLHPAQSEPAEREIVGYSEPADGAGSMTADAGFPNATPETVGPFSMADARNRAAQRAELAVAKIGPAGTMDPLKSLVDANLSADVNEDEDSSNDAAGVWGLIGGGVLLVAWMSARRRKKARAALAETTTAAAATAAAAAAVEGRLTKWMAALRAMLAETDSGTMAMAGEVTASRRISFGPQAGAAPHVRSRLDELIANAIPMEIEPVQLATPMEFFGRPRSRHRGRIDLPHPVAISAPHFGRTSEAAAVVVGAEPLPVAMHVAGGERRETVEVAVASAIRGPSDSVAAAAVVPSGHRVDEAHDVAAPAAGSGPRPHIGERKGDLLERVLTTVQEGGSRHVAAPHIAAAFAATETAVEGASQP